jgi:flagellar hook-length control protein FliK
VPVGQVTAAEPVAAHAAGLEPTRQPAERSAEVLPAQPAAPGMPSLSPPRDVAAPAVASLSAPVGSERFGQEVGERVAWMLDRDLGSAQLKLNPPQLGPLEVRVQVSGDQANVSFSAHNYLTRDALEQATPRLREMLGAQGFAQVNVSVSQHSFSERPPRPAPYEQPAGRAAAPLADIAAAAVPQPRAAAGLLDAYA